MERKEHIEQEVEKTLQCFETSEKIEPNPFFYTRLHAKIRALEEKEERSRRQRFILSSLGPALLVFLVVLNVLSAILVFRESEDQSDVRSQYIAAFVEEYSLGQDDNDLFLSNN